MRKNRNRKPPKQAIHIHLERSVFVDGSQVDGPISTGDGHALFGGMGELIGEQFAALKTELSANANRDLEHYRQIFREGNLNEGFEGVVSLTRLDSWPSLEASVRARILQNQASMLLDLHGASVLASVTELIEKASKLDPQLDLLATRLQIKLSEGNFEDVKEFPYDAGADVQFYSLLHLFNRREYQRIVEILNNIPEGKPVGSHARRVFALNFIALGNIDAAQLEIEKAKAQSPTWYSVRHTAAMIDYCRSISPRGLPARFTKYPEVVQFAVVKADTESQTRFAASALEFQKLAETHLEGHEERQTCEQWRFACLANGIETQDEAVRYGKELLEKNPTNVQILYWFLFRGYEWDFDRSLQELIRLDPKTPDRVQDALTIVMILLRLGRPKEAIAESDRLKDAFVTDETEDILRLWLGKCFLELNNSKSAKKENSKMKSAALKRSLKMDILAYEAHRSGDDSALIKYFKKGYEMRGDDESFVAYYEINSRKLTDKEFAISQAERFCEVVQTPFSVELAAYALSKLKLNEKAWALCEKFASFFPDAKLPAHLRRLKVDVLRKTDIVKAVEEASKLAAEENTAETLSLLIEVQREKSDLRGVASTAKDLLERDDAKADHLVRAAHLAKFTDRDLAQKLLEKALAESPQDTQTRMHAHSLALQLGLEDLGRPLMQKMMDDAHSGKGPMKVMNLDEAVEVMRNHSAANSELDKLYGTGQIPVHLWGNRRSLPMTVLYSGVGGHNTTLTDFQDKFRIMGRHASRIDRPEEFFQKPWRIHLDITSLLLANHLRILDRLEQLGNPIAISRQTITSLMEQRDRILPNQKSVIDNARAIKRLIDTRKARLFEAAFSEEELADLYCAGADQKKKRSGKSSDAIAITKENARTELGDRIPAILSAIRRKSFAVGFLPLTGYASLGMRPVALSPKATERIVNARSLAEALQDSGRISSEQYSQAISRLGVEGTKKSDATPSLGSAIYFMPDVERVLASAEILDEVCENFETYFDPASLKAAEDETKNFLEQEVRDAELNLLLARINVGLSGGTYELIDTSQTIPEIERLGIETLAVEELLRYPIKEGDLIAIDDRFINRHTFRVEGDIEAPVVCIVDLLRLLHTRGLVETSVYYRKRLELREMNYRYLPLNSEEILYHVNASRIEGEQLRESDAMKILRQYQASCLLDKDFLQLQGQFSESQFIVQSVDATLAAITDLWKDESVPVETAMSRSNWIIDNLYTGHLGVIHLATFEDEDKRQAFAQQLVSIDIQALFVRGMFMMGDTLSSPLHARRRAYFEWLEDRFLRTQSADQTTAITGVGKLFIPQFEGLFTGEFPNETYRKIAGITLGQLFLDFPEPIRVNFDLSENMQEWLHVRVGNVISAGNLNFEPDKYWRAVEAAIQGGTGVARSIDGDDEYSFVRGKDRDGNPLFPRIEIKGSDGKVTGVQDLSFGLFAADRASRISSLEQLRHVFDCGSKEFQRLAAELADISSPSGRADEFFEIRNQSIWHRYRELEDRFASGATIAWSELLPPPEDQFLLYYRVNNDLTDQAFSATWERAVEQMLDDDGIDMTISKVSKLPLKIPDAAIDGFAALAVDKRMALVRRLSGDWASPVRILQLANLLARTSAPSDEVLIQLANELLDRLYSQAGKQSYKAFHSVLSFVGESIHGPGSIATPASLFLAWGHSSILYQILRASGLSDETLLDSFAKRRGNNPMTTIERGPTYSNDCSSPLRVNWTIFSTHGAASLLTGVDATMINALNLAERIDKIAIFRDSKELELPAYALNVDPLLYSDRMCSIFAGSRFDSLSPLITNEALSYIRPESLQETVSVHLRKLKAEPTDLLPWRLVYMISSDLYLEGEARDLSRQALLSFDAANLPLTEEAGPSYTMLSALNQAGQFYDDAEVRSHAREQILKLQQLLPGADTSKWAAEMHGVLIDAAIAVCRHSDAVTATRDLTTLIESLYRRDRGIKMSHGYMIDLMTADSHHTVSPYWWKLKLLMRTGPEPFM